MADQAPRQRRSKDEWRALIAECAESGMTQVAFCKERGVSVCTFRDWKHRLYPGQRSRRGRSKAPFVPVVVDGGPPVAAHAGITIEWRHGRLLRVPSELPAGRVAELVHALEARSRGTVAGS